MIVLISAHIYIFLHIYNLFLTFIISSTLLQFDPHLL